MIRTKSRFWLFLLLLFVFFLFWLIIRNDILFQLTILSALILLISFVFTLFSLQGISIDRKSRTNRQIVGEFFEEYLEVKNQSILPKIRVEIIDHSELEDHLSSRVISTIGRHQSRTFNIYTLLIKRGMINLGPIEIRSGDPFGIFISTKIVKNSNTLLIMPFYYELFKFQSPLGSLLGGKTFRQPSVETTPHAAGIREYTSGDPLNRIHWPSSIKRNRLMVKEFDKDPMDSAWIFLDSRLSSRVYRQTNDDVLSNKMAWIQRKSKYQLPCDSYEYAISIAATIANYYIKHGRAAGLISAGKQFHILPAENGERQLIKIFETLALIQPGEGLPLLSLVQEEIKNIIRGATVVLITTCANAEIAIASDLINRQGLKSMLFYLDALSFGKSEKINLEQNYRFLENSPSITIHFGDDIKSILESESDLR